MDRAADALSRPAPRRRARRPSALWAVRGPISQRRYWMLAGIGLALPLAAWTALAAFGTVDRVFLPGPLDVGQGGRVHFEHAELTFHEQDAGLDRGHRPQRQVGHPLDGERGCHLHDERVLALERRVAPGAGRRAQVRGELRLQVPHQEVDAQLGRPVAPGS